MSDPRSPRYEWGQRVRALKDLHNDGTFPDSEPDALLVPAGDTGEVVRVGTHAGLDTPVYLVEFTVGRIVGCLEEEIVPIWRQDRGE